MHNTYCLIYSSTNYNFARGDTNTRKSIMRISIFLLPKHTLRQSSW